jgi:tRNA-2-methylthio-N6-dimethylallyladenosine synthase
MNKTYFIKTFGCQMNVADSQRIEKSFIDRGYKPAKSAQKANFVVIVSCMVRESAENRVYGLINNLHKQGVKKIILTGCLAGCLINGRLPRFYQNLIKSKTANVDIVAVEDLASFDLPPARNGDTAWIPISNGCNNFCSYCIVPFARGKEISRPIKDIVEEVKQSVSNGFKNITLLGQNVNSYGSDLATNNRHKNITIVKSMGKRRIPSLFPHLLNKVARIDGVEYLDFMSSNPWDFSDDLIRVIAENKNITKTLHLPVQSGDDDILKLMNRNYASKEYLKLLNKIRKAIPEAKFTTDIIVGFPGESKKQFENTAKLCKKIGFKKAYISRYSPRYGTAASKIEDDVSPKEKKRRWLELENLINH